MKRIQLMIQEELLKKIDAVSTDRSAYIRDAIEKKLVGEMSKAESDSGLTDAEKRSLIKGAKNLNDMFRERIMIEAERRQDFLSSLDNDEFARLVSSRLQKEEGSDVDLERSVFDARACLERMPKIEDLTKELRVAKGNVIRAETERDINAKVLKFKDRDGSIVELMKEIYVSAVRYVMDLVARNSVCGMGDGSGLSERGYEAIARKVGEDVKGLKCYGMNRV